MDGRTAFEAGNYYLAKAYDDAASKDLENDAPADDGARKAVLKEIRLQIKANDENLKKAEKNLIRRKKAATGRPS